MVRKARILVTQECNRHCSYCCNTPEMLAQAKPFRMWNELGDVDEIMITGGEPQLLDLHYWIETANHYYPRAKIYLYTTVATSTTKTYLEKLDGVQFTLHTNSTVVDARSVEYMQDLIRWRKGIAPFSARLQIMKGCNINFQLDTKAWDRIQLIEWVENCPLPPGETLYIPASTF